MPTDFKNCYETLGLTPDADWRKVQSTYRQLLIRWHPDRHRENNVTEDHAKQHFISLSTSFNALRDFHRQHKRLPLQQSDVDTTFSEPPISQSGDYRQVNAAAIKRKRQQAEAQKERLRKHQQSPSFKEQLNDIRSKRHVMTGLAILLVLMLALLLFFVLDSTNSAWRHDEAKRIVIEKGPSEFDMPAEDVLRGRSSK